MMKVKGIETYRCGYDTGVNLENNDSPFSTVMTKRGIHEREYDSFEKYSLQQNTDSIRIFGTTIKE